MSGVEIAGYGHYVPDRIVKNSEIEDRLGVDPGWIERRTGILQRRYAADGEALSDLAIAAGRNAIEQSRIPKNSISLVLLATSTPDHLLPPTAPLVAHRLGLERAGGIDMAGACGGFLYALALADSFVRSHGQAVLVIAANILSRRTNPDERASSVLFGDAAGAVVLQPSARSAAGALAVELSSAGQHYDLIKISGGGSRKPYSEISDNSDVLMTIEDGKKVFVEATDMMIQACRSVLKRCDFQAADVSHFIPHQANARMMDRVAHELGIDDKRMCRTVDIYGNSSAATIPLTLSACNKDCAYQQGDMLLMTAAGAGLTGGAVLWRW